MHQAGCRTARNVGGAGRDVVASPLKCRNGQKRPLRQRSKPSIYKKMRITGGIGGTLQLNFFGLIRNFTDGSYDTCGISGEDRCPSNIPVLTGGENSLGEKSGENGKLIYNKKECLAYLNMNLSDVDINGDGRVDFADISIIQTDYNALFGEENYSISYDINCDDKMNIQDMAKIGFKWNRGNTWFE